MVHNSHVYSIKFKQSAPLKPMTVGTKFTASTNHPWSKVQVRFRANPYIQDHFRMHCWTTRSFLLLKYVCRVSLNIGVSSWKTWILSVEVIVSKVWIRILSEKASRCYATTVDTYKFSYLSIRSCFLLCIGQTTQRIKTRSNFLFFKVNQFLCQLQTITLWKQNTELTEFQHWSHINGINLHVREVA